MHPNQVSTEKKNRESSIRWQGRTLEQFGYALNLIVGLTVATLGYMFSFLLSQIKVLNCWQTSCSIISILFLLISVGLGLWCVLNRLLDFKTTTEIAYKRENGNSKVDLKPLRTYANTLGERTWFLFKLELLALVIGILLITIVIVSFITPI